MKLSQAYDVLEAMKRIVDEDNGLRAKAVLEAYPQLVPAFLEVQRRLGMVTSAEPRRASLPRIDVPLSTSAATTSSAQHQMHQVRLDFSPFLSSFIHSTLLSSTLLEIRL
jgi:hypothetical protein